MYPAVFAGSSSSAFPKLGKKSGLQASSLGGEAIILIPGVLSAWEAESIVAAAERIGFEHQGSRGPAHGEVHPPLPPCNVSWNTNLS